MPRRDVNQQNSSLFVLCFNVANNMVSRLCVCVHSAHTRTWRTRGGFRMIANREYEAHTTSRCILIALFGLQQSPNSINIHNLLLLKWFFGRAPCRSAPCHCHIVPFMTKCRQFMHACSCRYFISTERMHIHTNCIFRISRFIELT